MKETSDGTVLHIAAQMTTLWAQKQKNVTTETLSGAFLRFYEVVNSRVDGSDVEIKALKEDGFEPVGAERWVNQTPRYKHPANTPSPNFGKPLGLVVDMSHLKPLEEVCPGAV